MTWYTSTPLTLREYPVSENQLQDRRVEMYLVGAEDPSDFSNPVLHVVIFLECLMNHTVSNNWRNE